MKYPVQNYLFNPATRQITVLDSIPAWTLQNLLVIMNVTLPRKTMLYNFASTDLGATVNGNVITLSFDTTTMSSTDTLQIYLDIQTEEPAYELEPIMASYTYDENLSQVLGTQPLTENQRLRTRIADFAQGSRVCKAMSLGTDAVKIDCNGMQTVAVQLAGTWTGTVSFEASVDGGNYLAKTGVRIDNAPVSSLTANNIILFAVAGHDSIQARFTTATTGTVFVTMVSTSAILNNTVNSISVSGSQASLNQRATTFELNTFDTNLYLATRLGFTVPEFPVAPTVNPAQPAAYPAPVFANWPQYFPRLRVEIGGDKKLPLAQESNSNKLLTVDTEVRQLLEQILLQLTLMNQNTATPDKVEIPVGFELR